MGITFILGRANSNHSAYIINEIKEKLKDEPIGSPIIYIVPEQMTFQQEYTLFHDDAIQGSIRAQVFSFSRLAWRMMSEVGGGARQFISSTGIQMMLRKIIEQQENTFNIFQRAIEKQGFIEELEQVMTEFKRHCISPDHLQEQVHLIEHEPLKNKLSDLHYIYQQLVLSLQDKYIDGEDQLQMLANNILKTDILKNAEIYIDGFHRFTPIELEVIKSLLKRCKNVTVSLTTDSVDETYSEFDLFYQTTETYHTLKQMADELNVVINRPIILEESDKINNEAFIHLEKNFDVRPTPSFDQNKSVPIEIKEAVHPRAEVEGVAQQILTLVRENGYRFRDIAIYMREPDVYESLIKTIFSDLHIPVFIDEKRMMLNHPLIEFVRSLLDMVESNWRYDALFRVLKTGFIQPTDDEYPLTNDAIDRLENYVLEFGIKYKNDWLKKDRWIYNRFRGFTKTTQFDYEKELEEAINRYRDQVVDSLYKFDKQINEAETNAKRCEAIFLLLERLNLPKQLEKLQEQYDANGEVEKAREQEQVWDALIQLLDEFVELIGDEKMPFKTFRDILDAGFESLEFSHVPPTIDHVIVGTIDHSRIAQKKASFLLGVNEGIWPMTPPVEGIINEEERELLKLHGLALAESSRRVLLDDLFYMYLAFTSATDYLWVSYPISNEEGDGKQPSQMIRRLQNIFPSIKNLEFLQDPDELIDVRRFITTKKQTRAALSIQLSRYLYGYQMDEVWWYVLNWYIENEKKNSLTYHVLQSLFYQNKPVSLNRQTVRKMYKKEISSSISRLERFYQCSYKHFAEYNLQLEERRAYKLEAPDIGQLFHEALKIITNWVHDEGRHFQDLTKDDATHYANRSIKKLAPVLQHRILSSSQRYRYIQRKLKDVISRATFILSEQARASGFTPVGIELSFGPNRDLEPLIIDLPNNYQMVLRGQIDRVDKTKHNGELYLRIIDYKSSEHRLQLLNVYYGIALQMLTYLNVVLTQSEKWLGQEAHPAGVLYFHLHNQQLNLKERLSTDELFIEKLKSHKMTGLLIDNIDIVRLMDTTLESGHSHIVPASITKNDKFYSNSTYVKEKEVFETLQQYIHQLIKRAGIKMISGDISLNPYEYKGQNACTFCSFQSVCQFDPVLPENNYHQLKDLKDDEVIEQMKNEKIKED